VFDWHSLLRASAAFALTCIAIGTVSAANAQIESTTVTVVDSSNGHNLLQAQFTAPPAVSGAVSYTNNKNGTYNVVWNSSVDVTGQAVCSNPGYSNELMTLYPNVPETCTLTQNNPTTGGGSLPPVTIAFSALTATGLNAFINFTSYPNNNNSLSGGRIGFGDGTGWFDLTYITTQGFWSGYHTYPKAGTYTITVDIYYTPPFSTTKSTATASTNISVQGSPITTSPPLSGTPPISVIQNISATSWTNRVDIFTQGTDNALYHTNGNGAAPWTWEGLGGILVGATN
jgi:hypothetical protein